MQMKLSELQHWSDHCQLNISYRRCSVLLLNKLKGGCQANLIFGDRAIPK